MSSKYLTGPLLSLVVAFGAAGFMSPAGAAENAQQSKMSSCNADAKSKNLKGDDRKAFMKTCLSNAPAVAPALNSQQEKMKTCNADAKTKNLKGDARKSFMSDCLKGG